MMLLPVGPGGHHVSARLAQPMRRRMRPGGVREVHAADSYGAARQLATLECGDSSPLSVGARSARRATHRLRRQPKSGDESPHSICRSKCVAFPADTGLSHSMKLPIFLSLALATSAFAHDASKEMAKAA